MSNETVSFHKKTKVSEKEKGSHEFITYSFFSLFVLLNEFLILILFIDEDTNLVQWAGTG